MHDHDDFAFDPIPGLPGIPPKGEEILWQGKPHALTLARQAFAVNWVAGYFALLVIWRVGVSSTSYPMAEAIGHGVPFLILGVLSCAILTFFAWVQSRATIYTITTHRVAIKMGAALQMTLNLPFTQVNNANFALNKNGTGTIALELKQEDAKLSYLMTWPHVRPWRMANPEPALRCIPEAAKIASLLAQAAETRVSDTSSIRVSAPDALPTPAE
ncbi:MAG: photosynthetic complex putative assembly protein PuhB [Pseudomonadota bacterium]